MNKKVILMILDGWGIAKNKEVSAVDKANTPFIDGLYTKYQHSKLQASGLAVGLPDGQMGNSEVGHMNLGAGRVVYQDLVKINLAVENKTLANEPAFANAIDYAKKNNKKIHYIGLVSDGGVHSHINHLKGLCEMTAAAGINNFFIHFFADGRDTDPKSGLGYLTDLQNTLDITGGKIASVIGRYYSMDRDNRWERVKLAYDLLVHAEGTHFKSAEEAIKTSYEKDPRGDEFILPSVIVDANNQPLAKIEEGDVVISFNYRTDRGREITIALTQKEFHEQNMYPLNLHYVTMTNYDATFKNVHVIFDKDNLVNTLGEVVSAAGKKQIRIAETEKYPHVTFFFSGGREAEFPGEKRLLCPSPKVATYDLQPEMSAFDIRDAIIPELKKGEVDFVCLNFANPDMVGHTGIMEAAIKACESVDQCASAVITAGLENGYSTLVIADHGNADCMQNEDGSPNTAHTTQPVPCILVDKEYNKPLKDGKLGDIAPTILELLGVKQPAEMTGTSILS
ncbi:MAG: 2,3-bisphosphoglycerate-independent phosphoglycerate mutase [Cytophagales bacterium]